MIKEAIGKVVKNKDLTAHEMESAFSEIMSGKAESSQISAFITGLRMKGETIQEITSAAKVMRKFAATINVRKSTEPVLDTCGTGGSGKDTFNISTAVAFVVAGTGVKVAKHGNRSASSRCGSADVLEALGVHINLSPSNVERCIKRIGIGFMFAPIFHAAMKYAVPVRRAIGIRTIFNILGPLSNPANATCQVIGVYDKSLTALMAKVLGNLGIKRAFVVHGLEGLDEVSISGPTQISELRNKRVRTYKITPNKFNIKRAGLKSIRGSNAKENKKIILSLLGGKKGPRRDVLILNSAYALVAAERAKNIKQGIRLAEESIDSGAALKKLKQLKGFRK
ncbi:MAG: anthranilate phosphoribosyltransferase [Candidatus Omnitrophica bacterium]|nr:anthranilate phosphoribosyltransferase [Candidatus Omnitrophota bacterium]